MRMSALVACVLSAVLFTGCVSVQLGTEKNPSRLQVKGLASGYVTLEGIQPYKGTILKFGLLAESEGPGEIASLDIWPLMSVGVGFIGARAQVLPVQAGLGILWYEPKPRVSHKEEHRAEAAPKAPPDAPSPEQ